MSMGIESSQLRRGQEELAEPRQRGGRVIGPPMSPTRPPYPGELRDVKSSGRGITDSGDEARPHDSESPKKKKKKKRKRRHEGPDSDANNELSDAPTAVMAADDDDAPAPTPESAKKRKGKKKSHRKKHERAQSPDPQNLLISHAVGGSPPSAQEPVTNGIGEHAPTIDAEQAEEHVVPESSVEEVDLNPSHLKTEPRVSSDEVPDRELPFRIADDRIVDGDDPRRKSSFMHKREMSMVDGASDLQSDDEAPLPDLQPNQVKTEPPSSESESDLASPSGARLGRLERSRSRSMSRLPPATKPAKNLESRARAASIAPSRSSTGSNKSIPARIEDVRPVSRGSSHASRQRDIQLNGDAMDLDENHQGRVNGHVSPPKKEASRAKSARKTTTHHQVHGINTEASGAYAGTDAPASSRKNVAQKINNTVPNTIVDKVTSWLSQPAKRRTRDDVVEESDHEVARQIEETAVRNDTEAQSPVDNEPPVEAEPPVEDEPPVDDEPEIPIQEPKKVKKRRLQSKESLSLSQLEDDFDEEGETHPRVSLSQRSKLKDIMRGDGRSPEDETGTNVEPSQEATLPKQPKPKRKRRPNDASEDELENLLAGPSRRKKSKNSSKVPGPHDPEETTVAPKKKRSSRPGAATGAWTTEELSALGKVVDQFRRAYDISQSEMNVLIHQRPDKGNEMHKDFWDSAAAAIQQRTRKQIVERTRRLYNNFVGRGRWDEEQKKELHELFEKHGTKYAEIASIINRDQKDIRDYWRNHYVVDGHQRKWYWKPEETEKLMQAVQEALHKIRIDRENNDQFRPRPRAKGFDDESLLDWQQISSAMGLTRSRQQCKWKWQELKDNGEAGVENDHLPKASRRTRTINGLSEALANAREDYRVMSVEEQLQLVEAIHDSGCSRDSKLKWKSLVDEHFRAKWRRPTLKLVWFRLRKTVPEHEGQDVQSNARYLLNYYNLQQSLPRIEDNQADDEVEERLVNVAPGSKVWRTPSQEPRAVRERQRRSSSASSRASSRASEKVSSQILRIPGNDDEQGEPAQRGRDHTPRSGSADLGQDGVETAEEHQQRKKSKGKGKSTREQKRQEAVPVRVPAHLNGDGTEEASAESRPIQQPTAAEAGKEKAKMKNKRKKTAKSPPPPAGGWKSASIAADSASE